MINTEDFNAREFEERGAISLSPSFSNFASDCSSSRFERALLETGRGTPPESCFNTYIFSNPFESFFSNNNSILRFFNLTTNRTII